MELVLDPREGQRLACSTLRATRVSCLALCPLPDRRHLLSKRARYQIQADRDGLNLRINSDFWNDNIADPKTGTTYLDINIAQVIQEIRAALYFVATDGIRH